MRVVGLFADPFVSKKYCFTKVINSGIALTQVGQIDADLKVKSSAYNALKGNLQNLEKKQT